MSGENQPRFVKVMTACEFLELLDKGYDKEAPTIMTSNGVKDDVERAVLEHLTELRQMPQPRSPLLLAPTRGTQSGKLRGLKYWSNVTQDDLKFTNLRVVAFYGEFLAARGLIFPCLFRLQCSACLEQSRL